MDNNDVDDERLQRIALVGHNILHQKHISKAAKKRREAVEDARFQVYHKYSAHGYDSPKQMLENEPDYKDFLRGHFEDSEPNQDEGVVVLNSTALTLAKTHWRSSDKWIAILRTHTH
jgi:hypothetical protein